MDHRETRGEYALFGRTPTSGKQPTLTEQAVLRQCATCDPIEEFLQPSEHCTPMPRFVLVRKFEDCSYSMISDMSIEVDVFESTTDLAQEQDAREEERNSNGNFHKDFGPSALATRPLQEERTPSPSHIDTKQSESTARRNAFAEQKGSLMAKATRWNMDMGIDPEDTGTTQLSSIERTRNFPQEHDSRDGASSLAFDEIQLSDSTARRKIFSRQKRSAMAKATRWKSSGHDSTVTNQILFNSPKKDIGEEGKICVDPHDVSLVNLTSSGIGDEGAIALASTLRTNNTITRVNLAYNGIGDSGAKALAESLRINTTVKEIDLEGNNFTCQGAKSLALMLLYNRTIEVIMLGENKIGEDGAMAVATSLRHNVAITTIDLSRNLISSREIYNEINRSVEMNVADTVESLLVKAPEIDICEESKQKVPQ